MTVSNLESKLLGPKKPNPKPAPEAKAPIESHEVSANEPPVKPEVMMGFTFMKPSEIYLHGVDPLPEGFDVKALEAFADPYRLAYDESNPGYAAYKAAAQEAKRIKKPVEVVVLKSTDGSKTLFPANDGRQSTKIARELGFETVPVISTNETDSNEVALHTVEANTGVRDSILVKAAKAQALSDRKPKINQRRIATAFGETQSTVNNWLKLNKASDYLKQLIVNGEAGVKPGVAWTTAAAMISKKWTDEQIRETVEGPATVESEGGGEEGEDTGEVEQNEAPARATASSIFGSFKDDFLSVINAKGFVLPESLAQATPLEMFILGAETAFAKKVDNLADDFKKMLNAKMALRRKAVERAAKRAAGDKLTGE